MAKRKKNKCYFFRCVKFLFSNQSLWQFVDASLSLISEVSERACKIGENIMWAVAVRRDDLSIHQHRNEANQWWAFVISSKRVFSKKCRRPSPRHDGDTPEVRVKSSASMLHYLPAHVRLVWMRRTIVSVRNSRASYKWTRNHSGMIFRFRWPIAIVALQNERNFFCCRLFNFNLRIEASNYRWHSLSHGISSRPQKANSNQNEICVSVSWWFARLLLAAKFISFTFLLLHRSVVSFCVSNLHASAHHN